ncbi:major capsid protein [Desulfovibrio sp.]|uniref:major capsid protein n=1 Tax=Desulfovibrio sp. TaxID=885 RepID=UPI00307937AF
MRKRSKFSLSHYVLKTCKMGYVLPVGLVEVLPGDSFRHATSVFMRLAPMLAPVMHPVTVRIHHWFIPTRLLWDDFEDFITGGPTNTDVSEFPTITAPSGGFAVGSLADHLGLPPKIDGIEVSALPFRAYNLVYNEWYRDQDLETEKALSLESGPDTTTATDLLRCDWERDYFTTARPWPQKGPDVSVPVNAVGFNVAGKVVPDTSVSGPTFQHVGYLYPHSLQVPGGSASAAAPVSIPTDTNVSSEYRGLQWGEPALKAVMDKVEGSLGSVNINSLREAFALQRFAEHRAMYGSRYVEYLRYLGIKASDARLQRPEYLGGGKQTVQFSEVLQTAEGTDPVGTLRGHGIAAMRSNRYRRFFEEHGFVLSIMLVRPKAIYMQGIPRSWLRRVREDFFQTELQHIGQQEVYTKELYGAASDGENGDLKVFGYQNRYDEYRGHESYVCGEFRDILDYWHLARSFSNEPVLNADFISATPSERIFAAQQNDQLYCMINHSLQARRLMSKFGNPI